MILALGTVTLDTVEIGGRSHEHQIGGSALYFAAAAAALFSPVRLVGIVGHDYPVERLAPLAAAGIDLGGLRNGAGPSQSWHARYLGAGNIRETVESDRSILTGFCPELGDREASAGYVFLGSTHPSAQRCLLKQIPRASSALVMLDSMGHWIERCRDQLRGDLPRVDILLGSEAEICQWSDRPDPEGGARALLDLGPRCVVVKRGDSGATVVADWGQLSRPALKAPTVDPTGAGDAFAGGFLGTLAALCAGRSELWAAESPLADALEAGLAAGARAVSGLSLEGLVPPAV